MKYGEALKIVFDAFYEDRRNISTTRSTPSLHEAIKKLPTHWKSQIMTDFSAISRTIKDSILSCPHPEESRVVPYYGCEECSKCGAYRRLGLEDSNPHSYNEHKIWSPWMVQ